MAGETPAISDTSDGGSINGARRASMRVNALALLVRQPGDLRVLREVFYGFSKEARTRGFPSPSFGRFGFVVVNS